MACIALHNFSKTTDNPAYCPTGYVDRETANGDVIPGNWRRESQSSSASADGNLGDCVSVLRGRRTSGNALHMRDCLRDYVNSEIGSLPWQLDYVRRTK